MLAKKFYFNNSRLTTDLSMILLSMAGCYLASIYAPENTFNENVSIGLGYVSLLMLAITLLIGPINLLRKRKNPVNINLRRDIGIWSGITACLHVAFSLQIYPGKGILEYFVGQPQGALPTYGLFEIGNDVGLIATIIIVALMATSNQVSLIWLKGKRWKLLQRFNYGLIALALFHTFAFQVYNLRESYFFYAVIALSLAVLAAQVGGIAITISRAQARKTATVTPPAVVTAATAPVVVAQSGQITMARRRFLAVTGATLLGGVAVSGTAGYLLGRTQGESKALTLAQVPANTANPATGNNPGVANNPANPNTGANTGNTGAPPSNGFGRQRGGFGGQGNFGANPGAGGAVSPTTPPAGSAAQGGSGATQTTPAAGASSQSGSTSTGRSLVLGNFASLPAGSALKFTTPDTGETAFVIHEQDGSVKAYSGICTHRPYTLVFDQSQQALVCNLHNVPFNIITGAPTRRPASVPLQSYTVHIDAQNNIVYG